MIVKFFRHGTGGGNAVFDYLLGEKGDRPDAEVLRGDVLTQKRLIDSLDFKRQYTSGCLSFEEGPDILSPDQKNEIMDSFEAAITAGMDNRVSFTWIEHRDKGRLELNFVIANVDLEHGRLFQPYIHCHDETRINTWKDIQNIKYELTDPNDPLKKRLMGQRDFLPKSIKEARETITEGITTLISEGHIKNRHDIINTLKEAGFEIARQTSTYISIKNPNGKNNIRLTGAIYERSFRVSEELQRELEEKSRDYRDRVSERLEDAQRLFHDKLEAKRSYHESRHDKPKRSAKAANKQHHSVSEISQRPDPKVPSADYSAPSRPHSAERHTSKGSDQTVSGLSDRNRSDDQRPAGKNSQINQRSYAGYRGTFDIRPKRPARTNPNDDLNPQSTSQKRLRNAPRSSPNLHFQQVLDIPWHLLHSSFRYIHPWPYGCPPNKINDHAKTTVRTNQPRHEREPRHHHAPRPNHQPAREDDSRPKRHDSGIKGLINQFGQHSKSRDSKIAEAVITAGRYLQTKQRSTAELTQSADGLSKAAARLAQGATSTGDLSERLQSKSAAIIKSDRALNRAADGIGRDIEAVSQRIADKQPVNERYQRLRGQIDNHIQSNQDLAGRNIQSAAELRRAAEHIEQVNKNLEIEREKRLAAERSRDTGFSFGM